MANMAKVNIADKVVRLIKTICLISHFFRVAKSWNSLPLHKNKFESLKEFKDRLKSYLRQKDAFSFSYNYFFLLVQYLIINFIYFYLINVPKI